MWVTDSSGMMEMKTVSAGFYVERKIHIHAQVHTNWIIGSNGTMVSDNTISTAPLFFAEDLSAQIMALEPYASHTPKRQSVQSLQRCPTDVLSHRN